MWKEMALRVALELAKPLFCAATARIPQSRKMDGLNTNELGKGKTIAYTEVIAEDTVVHIPTGASAMIFINDNKVVHVQDHAWSGTHCVEIHVEGGSGHTLRFTGERYELPDIPGVIVENNGPSDNGDQYPVFFPPKKK